MAQRIYEKEHDEARKEARKKAMAQTAHKSPSGNRSPLQKLESPTDGEFLFLLDVSQSLISHPSVTVLEVWFAGLFLPSSASSSGRRGDQICTNARISFALPNRLSL